MSGFVCFILLILAFGGCAIQNDIKTKIEDGDQIYSVKLGACAIAATELENALQCHGEKGDKGNSGFHGLSGKPGPPGEIGPQGPPGPRGEQGERGLKGDPGQSIKGEKGAMGPKGDIGEGEKGNQGIKGPPGSAGLAGTCLQEFEISSESDEDMDLATIGTAENPANFLCHSVLNMDGEKKTLKGDIWVLKGDQFKVRCEEKTHWTCLIVKPYSDIYAQDHALKYGNEKKPFWLSKKTFNLTQFYNGITEKQIDWLRSKSTQVIQKIKYYCKNSRVAEYEETALKLYTFSGLTVGPFTTEYSPLSYSLPDKSHGCTDEAYDWGYSEIVITGSSKRLPVADFLIRDIRNEDQRIFVELKELCFG